MEEAIKDLTRTPFVPSGAPPNRIGSHTIDRRRRETTRPLLRRWSLAAGLAMMAVIIFGLGLILGHPDLGWRENLTRLSQRVFLSQNTSQGGGAGGTPTTELPGENIQARMNQTIEAARVPTEKVEAEPVPAGGAKDEPSPTETVKAASVPAEKAEAEPPALEVTTAPAPAEEIEATPVLAEELETARDSAKDVVAAGVSPDKVDPKSTAAAPQANVLPELVGKTEETKKEAPQLAQKETTKDSEASQAPELPRQQLPLALSIRPGDTLTEIITQHYGSYNQETLRAVLHENPEIQNPDLIFAGEILKLPLSSEKP